jgi:acyl dehydratase
MNDRRDGRMMGDGGPFFEDLEVGMSDATAPAVTLTEGLAAVHQAIIGDRLRLALDVPLARRVLGGRAPLAHPALVWDIAIGQSTPITQRVIANLFYRGLVLRRSPVIGDSLHTTTEVAALRQAAPKRGRPARGLAVLRIRTVDQEERPVLDFWRCAMLPLRDPEGRTGREGNFAGIPEQLDRATLRSATAGWRFDRLPPVAGERASDLRPGARCTIERGDVVGAAPAAQTTRALPNIVTIIGWHACDHLAPVREGDTLRSELEVEQVEPLPRGGAPVGLRLGARAHRDAEVIDVLGWRFIAVML